MLIKGKSGILPVKLLFPRLSANQGNCPISGGRVPVRELFCAYSEFKFEFPICGKAPVRRLYDNPKEALNTVPRSVVEMKVQYEYRNESEVTYIMTGYRRLPRGQFQRIGLSSSLATLAACFQTLLEWLLPIGFHRAKGQSRKVQESQLVSFLPIDCPREPTPTPLLGLQAQLESCPRGYYSIIRDRRDR